MNDLQKTELFNLMNENSKEITNEQIQCAYGKFIAYIDTISQVRNDYANIIRKLNITRIELESLFKQFQYEQGGEMRINFATLIKHYLTLIPNYH